MFSKKLVFLIIVLLSFSAVFADDCAYMIFFYSTGCHACNLASPVLDEIESEYNIIIYMCDLHEAGNVQLLYYYLDLYDVPSNKWGYTPTSFIGNSYIIGYTPDFGDNIVSKIFDCYNGECVCPFNQSVAEYYNASPFPAVSNATGFIGSQTTPSNIDLNIPTIVSAALIDSINPCAFAVMIFLLTYLINMGNKKRVLIIGFSYIFAVFASYFLAGFGLFLTIQAVHISNIIYYVSAILAILAGLINVKDFFWYGKGFTLRIPARFKPSINKWAKEATIPAAIVLGFLVSMFELPCTGGVYLAILGLLSKSVSQASAVVLLLLYNIIFILPLIVLMFLVYFGYSAKGLESWRLKKRNYMKLFSGIFMILLGIVMLLNLF